MVGTTNRQPISMIANDHRFAARPPSPSTPEGMPRRVRTECAHTPGSGVPECASRPHRPRGPAARSAHPEPANISAPRLESRGVKALVGAPVVPATFTKRGDPRRRRLASLTGLTPRWFGVHRTCRSVPEEHRNRIRLDTEVPKGRCVRSAPRLDPCLTRRSLRRAYVGSDGAVPVVHSEEFTSGPTAGRARLPPVARLESEDSRRGGGVGQRPAPRAPSRGRPYELRRRQAASTFHPSSRRSRRFPSTSAGASSGVPAEHASTRSQTEPCRHRRRSAPASGRCPMPKPDSRRWSGLAANPALFEPRPWSGLGQCLRRGVASTWSRPVPPKRRGFDLDHGRPARPSTHLAAPPRSGSTPKGRLGRFVSAFRCRSALAGSSTRRSFKPARASRQSTAGTQVRSLPPEHPSWLAGCAARELQPPKRLPLARCAIRVASAGAPMGAPRVRTEPRRVPPAHATVSVRPKTIRARNGSGTEVRRRASKPLVRSPRRAIDRSASPPATDPW